MSIWETHLDGILMPNDFNDSSYGNDSAPSICHDSGLIQIWVHDEETWNDIGWDIKDFKKYYIMWHDSEEIYGTFPDGMVSKQVDTWLDVLTEIDVWREARDKVLGIKTSKIFDDHKCSMDNVIHESYDEGLGDAYYCAVCEKILQVG